LERRSGREMKTSVKDINIGNAHYNGEPGGGTEDTGAVLTRGLVEKVRESKGNYLGGGREWFCKD